MKAQVRDKIVGAALGGAVGIASTVLGTGMVLWRDLAVQRAEIVSALGRLATIEASVKSIEQTSNRLVIAVGILEARGQARHPVKKYLPVLGENR